MERKFHRFLWMMALGALLGAVASTWLAPRVIAWYWNPPAEMGINCLAPIQWSLRKLQLAQLVGITGGGILGTVLYFLIGRRRSQELSPRLDEPSDLH
jgi:hypothetical protein